MRVGVVHIAAVDFAAETDKPGVIRDNIGQCQRLLRDGPVITGGNAARDGASPHNAGRNRGVGFRYRNWVYADCHRARHARSRAAGDGRRVRIVAAASRPDFLNHGAGDGGRAGGQAADAPGEGAARDSPAGAAGIGETTGQGVRDGDAGFRGNIVNAEVPESDITLVGLETEVASGIGVQVSVRDGQLPAGFRRAGLPYFRHDLVGADAHPVGKPVVTRDAGDAGLGCSAVIPVRPGGLAAGPVGRHRIVEKPAGAVAGVAELPLVAPDHKVLLAA